MNVYKWLSELPQFLVLFPAAASCYFAVKNQMKYTVRKTAGLCLAVLVPVSALGAWVCAVLQVDANTILLPVLVFCFFLYRRTVNIDLSKALAVFVGVCAVQTFPAQFAYAFDAHLHPEAGAEYFSVEAALFQLGLSCLLVAAFAYPACGQFYWMVDHLDVPKVWHLAMIPSTVVLLVNILAVPVSYSTLHTGRISYIFPIVEACALALLTGIYVLFYRGAMIIMEHERLKERSQLFEMQSHQYRTLQEHMRQTARLRHDFRHSVHLLSSLAEKGDLDGIRLHLAEYENRIAENTSVHYCENAALDALFGYYHEAAVQAGIKIDWKLELPEPLTISELDMVGLFGNLMENAVAGCLGVPEGTRYFSLTAELRHGNRLYIVSTNSFNGQVRKGKDGFYSTKHGGRGIGLASIAAIAEKYQGTVQVSGEGKEFLVDVVLKV